MNAVTPWINLVSNLQPTQCETVHSATWAAWIRLRDYSELLGFQWGRNVRELRQDALERNLQFIKSIFTFRPIEQSWVRNFVLRIYKYGDKLKFLLIVRNIGLTIENAQQDASTSWQEFKSIYPYDYEIVPLIKEEFINSIPQNSPAANIGSNYITVFYPCTRFSFSSINNPILSIGNWSSSDASPEFIWRMLGDTASPTALEIYLQPTIMQSDERLALDALKTALQKQLDNNNYSNSTINGWFDNLAERTFSLCQPYLIQLRMFSNYPIALYTENIVGSALTYPSSGINSYETLHPSPEQLSCWQEAIENHNFINCGTLLPLPPRLPYFANLSEAASVFRAPYLSKGGIPDLNIDMVTKR